jgi:hypothetical protein
LHTFPLVAWKEGEVAQEYLSVPQFISRPIIMAGKMMTSIILMLAMRGQNGKL